MTPQAIATLRAGDEVAAVFACVRKDRLSTKAGAPYLAVELRDRTGSLPGRAFRDADALAARFDRGDLVRVTGRVERFRDELQLDLRSVVRADPREADPAQFLPVAFRDLDELEGFLEHLAREVHDPGLRGLLDRLLGDAALRAELRRAPAHRSLHHAYLGGLLEHTVAVGTLVLEACQLHVRLDRDLLLAAAIVHDLGRTREWTYGAEFGVSDEGRLLGHVQLGLEILRPHAGGLDPARRLALEHCVLTHHLDRRPGTPEALALARLDALDRDVKRVLEVGMDGVRPGTPAAG
jgi:3'-5' exoribonuclease